MMNDFSIIEQIKSVKKKKRGAFKDRTEYVNSHLDG